MSENEVMERVARAIAHLRMCDRQGNAVPCPSCDNARGYSEDYGCRTMARAVIAAMRVPTAAQGAAMYAAWDSFGEDAVMGPAEAIAIYQAAIDEALK